VGEDEYEDDFEDGSLPSQPPAKGGAGGGDTYSTDGHQQEVDELLAEREEVRTRMGAIRRQCEAAMPADVFARLFAPAAAAGGGGPVPPEEDGGAPHPDEAARGGSAASASTAADVQSLAGPAFLAFYRYEYALGCLRDVDRRLVDLGVGPTAFTWAER